MTFAAMNTRARMILHSYTNRDWTDNEIYEYLNDAYIDFSVRTEYFRKETSITITADTGIQSLPTDSITIYRAEWDGGIVTISDTSTMDEVYGDEWRTETGSAIETIIQDMEDYGKLRIYPILNAAAIGTTKLKLIHTYIPAEITAWTGSILLPVYTHESIVDYCIYMCLNTEVQSDQNIVLADRYYDKYMDMVTRMRRKVMRGVLNKSSQRVRMRNFV